jgi:prepilin-type N-terminal cleavage/methylation domain-containing protein
MHRHQTGFTLIELLVVIAIIGILAATIVVSMSNARRGSINSSVAQTVTNMRAQAEIFFSATNLNVYTGMCNAGTDIDRLVDGVIAANNAIAAKDNALANLQNSNTFMCHISVDGSSYAVSAPLMDVGNGQKYFCADSTGWASVTVNPLAANATVCSP